MPPPPAPRPSGPPTPPARNRRGGHALLPGSERILAAQSALLPQPDQLCGPFAAHLALQAVRPRAPGLAELARAAGTRVWPHDVLGWRPPGAVRDERCWVGLPRAAQAEDSGTDARPLALGLARLADVGVVAVPAAGVAPPRWGDLLGRLVAGGAGVGVVANLRTGPLGAPRPGDGTWDVGHYVVLWSWDAGTGEVGVADSYPELGAPGWPPACRGVALASLAAGLAAPPGRGLLLVICPDDAADLRATVAAAGLTPATEPTW